MDLLIQILKKLKEMDECLIVDDVNTALRKLHESITLIKDNTEKKENETE